MAHQQFTLPGAAGTGYVVTLDSPVQVLGILATSECYIKTIPTGTTAAAPGASPATAVGTQGSYYHLLAGQSLTIGQDIPAPLNTATGLPVVDNIASVQVWFIAAGELRGAGH